MKPTKKTFGEVSRKTKQKMDYAEKDFRAMLEEIKPFIKKRQIKQYSTAGKWRSSVCELADELN